MTLTNIFANWKTSSTGMVMIIGGITAMVFSVINKAVTQDAIVGCATAVLAGLGLIFAKDGANPNPPAPTP